MNNRSLRYAWQALKRQVGTLRLPWLEDMTRSSPARDPFRVLISCILSLRTQDRTTAHASGRLFSIAPDMRSLSRLSAGQIEKAIYPVGFYRTKAKRIKDLCRVLMQEYGSRVPDDLNDLLRLKGVGRKTANLVLTLGFSKPGICVDTHVHRITNRWGYVRTRTPRETEFALRRKLPGEFWFEINGLLVAFGQNICRPLSPFCSRCGIFRFCDREGVKKHR